MKPYSDQSFHVGPSWSLYLKTKQYISYQIGLVVDVDIFYKDEVSIYCTVYDIISDRLMGVVAWDTNVIYV